MGVAGLIIGCLVGGGVTAVATHVVHRDRSVNCGYGWNGNRPCRVMPRNLPDRNLPGRGFPRQAPGAPATPATPAPAAS